jgi:hypothetical protein
VFRHVSISCFGSHISDNCILNYVIDQATNGGFLSLADLSFLDDVSKFSLVKNYKKKLMRFWKQNCLIYRGLKSHLGLRGQGTDDKGLL